MKEHRKIIHEFPLKKFIQYKLHIGGLQKDWNPKVKPLLFGLRKRFGVLNLRFTHLSIRQSLKVLYKAAFSKKKILFVGSPIGLEKNFSILCNKYGHYHLSRYVNGFFTNFTEQPSENSFLLPSSENRPCLIVFFNVSANENVKKDLLRLNIPILAFVSIADNLSGIDYVIPANIQTWSGGLFVYNLFFHFFRLGKNEN